MAAILDMAFQLLAFFILTFNPSDVESQISMIMPANQLLSQGAGKSPATTPTETTSFGLPLPIQCIGNANGELQEIRIGGNSIRDEDPRAMIGRFKAELLKTIAVPGFEGVELSVDPNLNYDWLIRIVDLITSQKLPSGEALTRISISKIQ